MYENQLCCTYPEECTGCHTSDLVVAKQEIVFIWNILQVKEAAKKSSFLSGPTTKAAG